MTTEAKRLVKEFEALPDEIKREVLTELIVIAQRIDDPELTDEELLLAANDVFAIHDAEEIAE